MKKTVESDLCKCGHNRLVHADGRGACRIMECPCGGYQQELVTKFVTKGVFTKGIRELRLRALDSGGFITPNDPERPAFSDYFSASECHDTHEAAVACLQRMQQARITALYRQIGKLKVLAVKTTFLTDAERKQV